MRIRLAIALVAAVALAPVSAGAASKPFEPFRQLFRDPAGTIKRVMRTPPGSGAAKTAPAAKAPAAKAPPAVAEEPQTTAVPLPRLRPANGPADTLPAMGFAPATDDIPTAAFPPPAAAPAPAMDEIGLAERAAIPPDALPGRQPVVVPRVRPRIASAAPDAAPAKPPAAGRQLAALPPGGADTLSACKRSLAALGIEATPLAPIHEGACGVAAPTAVASLGGGAIPFSTKAIVNCAVAGALAAWMDDDVQPAAKRLLGGRVTGLRIAASYVCRGRNNVPGAKLSEHAYGNALDISAFRIANVGWVEVGNTRSPAEAAFLREIRQDACGPFTTVLGPGVAYHDTHFHLDLARRRTSGPSKGRYCK